MNKETYVRNIFSSIAKRYDFLNSLLSLNFDRSWRKFAVKVSEVRSDSRVLDVCSGTGELAIAYANAIGDHARVIGTDFCFEMLAVGKRKVEIQNRSHIFIPIEADTLALPFADNSFDIVSVGFGIRNVADLERGISEMTRVAKRGGRIVILEFTLPSLPIIKDLYYFYFKKILPILGNLISESRDDAYGYLPDSVMKFPNCNELKNIMENCGLINVQFYRRTFGIVAIHIGRKK